MAKEQSSDTSEFEAEEDTSKVVALSVESLLFDLQNPRFKGLTDQRDALNSLCVGLHAPKVTRLAEHISENGLNPSELLIVIRGERRRSFIVLEGNRRLAALKLLTMPARLADAPLSSAFKSRIKKASARTDQQSLQKIQCRRMASREQANIWISLKHTGENQGVGVVQWDGEETARFQGRENGYLLLDYAREHCNLSAAAKRGLDKFPITNLERLLGDPDARRAMGLDLRNGKLLITHDPAEVKKGLARVIEDLATSTITVTALKKKADRRDYIKKIQHDLPISDPLKEPKTLDGSMPDTDTQSTRNTTQSASSKSSTKKSQLVRATLVSPSCRLPITEPRIERVFNELRSLKPLENYPNAGAALLRIFIDLSTLEYAEKLKPDGVKYNGHGQAELKSRIEAALNDVCKRNPGAKEAARSAKNALLQAHGIVRIDDLHLHVHGRYEIPQADKLRQGWEQIEPWMRAIWAVMDEVATAE